MTTAAVAETRFRPPKIIVLNNKLYELDTWPVMPGLFEFAWDGEDGALQYGSWDETMSRRPGSILVDLSYNEEMWSIEAHVRLGSACPS